MSGRDGALSTPVDRTVELPGTRELVVRSMTPADLDALVGLYSSMSEDDLYRRFFQARVPPRHVLERATRATERGDVALVVELIDRAPGGARSQLVAEAAYARLPNGNGDLAIAVAPPARGWLGPYLLAVLCEEAAARGVPNLEADVLLDNARMLALVRWRGYATIEHTLSPAIVRVAFSTTGPVPSWPPQRTRPRIVVESPGGRWHAESALRGAGVDVLVCPGPGTRWSRCPAVGGRPCPLVREADVVVDALGRDGGDGADGPHMAGLHHRLHPQTILFEEPQLEEPQLEETGERSLRLAGYARESGPLVTELVRLAGVAPPAESASG